jgi:hypothetical protein
VCDRTRGALNPTPKKTKNTQQKKAADALAVAGVGRNEYIETLNACRAKKLMWRVNRATLAREHLPQAPREPRLEPWWLVSVVNVGE